jgi:hypothetical protein
VQPKLGLEGSMMQPPIKTSGSLDSITLDLDQVGRYLARMPNTYYNRLTIMIESAGWEKENGGYDQERLF